MPNMKAPSPLWSLKTVTQAFGTLDGNGEKKNSQPWHAQGVSIDTRTLVADDLFFAIRGPRFDGHDFVETAAKKGASAAVVARPVRAPKDFPVVHTLETGRALHALGAAARTRCSGKMVAVTGSVGKTGVKEALAYSLRSQTRKDTTFASPGNLNNQWGLPLSLARMPPDTAFGIFELGMSRTGEILELARLVRPDVAVVTHISWAHAENFRSLQDIALAKAEIFRGLKKSGCAVLPFDSPFFPLLHAQAKAQGIARILHFGRKVGADMRLLQALPTQEGLQATVQWKKENFSFFLPHPGLHQAMNMLAVLLSVWALAGDVQQAGRHLSSLPSLDGRGRKYILTIPGGEVTLLDDSYNASPSSMRAALDVLHGLQPTMQGRRIALLGDMLELGTLSNQLHVGLAEKLRSIDIVFLYGSHMRALHDALPATRSGGWWTDLDALRTCLIACLRPGDVILVKGSAGMRLREFTRALPLSLRSSFPSLRTGSHESLSSNSVL